MLNNEEKQEIKNKFEVIDAYVYRNNALGDCTNNGASSKVDTMKILCNEKLRYYLEYESFRELLQEYMFEKSIDVILLIDIERAFCAPVFKGDKNLPTRFLYGGNMIYSSDSRFPAITALRIHDRLE